MGNIIIVNIYLRGVLIDVEYERVDLRDPLSEEQRKNNLRITELQFKLNHTFWLTEEYGKIEKELFNGNFGELSRITPPLNGVCFDLVQIGKNVVIFFANKVANFALAVHHKL